MWGRAVSFARLQPNGQSNGGFMPRGATVVMEVRMSHHTSDPTGVHAHARCTDVCRCVHVLFEGIATGTAGMC